MTQLQAKEARQEPDQTATAPAKIPQIEQSESAKQPKAKRPGKRAPTKKAMIQKLLARKSGATMDALVEATGWQPHSVRAALSGIRGTDVLLERSKNRGGKTVYAIKAVQSASASV